MGGWERRQDKVLTGYLVWSDKSAKSVSSRLCYCQRQKHASGKSLQDQQPPGLGCICHKKFKRLGGDGICESAPVAG